MKNRAGSSALVLVVHLGEFRVNDVFLSRLLGARCTSLSSGRTFRLGLLGFVHGFAELHRRLRQGSRLLLHLIGIAAFNRSLGFRERLLDLALHISRNLVAMLGELFLGRVNKTFGIVLGLG